MAVKAKKKKKKEKTKATTTPQPPAQPDTPIQQATIVDQWGKRIYKLWHNNVDRECWIVTVYTTEIEHFHLPDKEHLKPEIQHFLTQISKLKGNEQYRKFPESLIEFILFQQGPMLKLKELLLGEQNNAEAIQMEIKTIIEWQLENWEVFSLDYWLLKDFFYWYV